MNGITPVYPLSHSTLCTRLKPGLQRLSAGSAPLLSVTSAVVTAIAWGPHCNVALDAQDFLTRVGYVFGGVKRLWGFGKVRYVGLQKNATRAFTVLALANIFLGRQKLMAQVRP